MWYSCRGQLTIYLPHYCVLQASLVVPYPVMEELGGACPDVLS